MHGVWLALSLFVFIAGPASAQAPFQVAGFRHSLASSGMHYYACEAPTCGISTASFEYQDGLQDFTLSKFEDMMKVSFSALAPMGSETRSLSQPKMISSGKLRIWTMATSFLQPGRQPNYVVGGFITGGLRRVSLISAANSAAAAQRNFNAFYARLKPLILKGAPL